MPSKIGSLFYFLKGVVLNTEDILQKITLIKIQVHWSHRMNTVHLLTYLRSF